MGDWYSLVLIVILMKLLGLESQCKVWEFG